MEEPLGCAEAERAEGMGAAVARATAGGGEARRERREKRKVLAACKRGSVRGASREGVRLSTEEWEACLAVALEREHLDVAKILLKEPRVDPVAPCDGEILAKACGMGLVEAVQLIVPSKVVDVDRAIGAASSHGHSHVVLRLLEKTGQIEPGTEVSGSTALCSAIRRNASSKVVALLLKQTNPCGNQSLALRLASRHPGDQCETLAILLRDGRADPAASDSEALRSAAQDGNATVLEMLLKDGRADPTTRDSIALRRAVSGGHIDATKQLLRDGRANPGALGNEALRCAAEAGSLAIVKSLLADGRVDPHTCSGSILAAAVANKWNDLARTLLPQIDPAAEESRALRVAAERGNAAVLVLLLQDGRADPAAKRNCAILKAARLGHFDIVEILAMDARVNPCEQGNLVLLHAIHARQARLVDLLLHDERVACHARLMDACKCGHVDLVRALLSRVDPAAAASAALHVASERGSKEVVRVLLEDGRASPSTLESLALVAASQRRHVGVCELLLADPRVDPSGSENEALRKAVEIREPRIVELLLENDRVDHEGILTFEEAITRRWVGVVRALLDRVDPPRDAILLATKSSCPEIVRMLLADGRADPTAPEANAPLMTASHLGTFEVARMLLADSRVDPALCGTEALQSALDGPGMGRWSRFVKVLDMLLDQARFDPLVGRNIVDVHSWSFKEGRRAMLSLSLPEHWVRKKRTLQRLREKADARLLCRRRWRISIARAQLVLRLHRRWLAAYYAPEAKGFQRARQAFQDRAGAVQ